MMKNLSLLFLAILSFLIQGCASRPLIPSTTQGKKFAVYPASIVLTVKENKGLLGLVKNVSIFVVTAATTAGYATVTPGPGQKVSDGNLGPALMQELATRVEREFRMSKVSDLMPLGSSKSTGGQLTEAEVKSDYQNVADYLVQIDSIPSQLSVEGYGDNYTFRYFASVNIYDTKNGQRLDWAACSGGVQKTALLSDWFKDNGKMLETVTQEVASKCADEMIRKLNKS